MSKYAKNCAKSSGVAVHYYYYYYYYYIVFSKFKYKGNVNKSSLPKTNLIKFSKTHKHYKENETKK